MVRRKRNREKRPRLHSRNKTSLHPSTWSGVWVLGEPFDRLVLVFLVLSRRANLGEYQ
jgi:hypothetical protein